MTNASWDSGTIAGTATTAFDGILSYRDGNAPTGKDDVSIDGNASIELNGGLYFPSSDLNVNGSMTAGGATCTEIGSNTMTFSGNSPVALSGCAATGTNVTQFGPIMMVE